MAVREKRHILRSLFTPGSVKFWRLKNDRHRLLYIAMIANADDEGRLEADAESLESIVPRAKLDDKTIQEAVRDLSKRKLVRFYRYQGKKYAEIHGFEESQSWHGLTKEDSRLPSSKSSTSSGVQEHHACPGSSPPIYLSSIDRKVGTVDRKEKANGKDSGFDPKVEIGIAWRNRYHRAMKWFPSYEQSLVGLVRDWDAATVLRAWKEFLKEESDWLTRKRHPFGAFAKQFEHYVVDEVPAEAKPTVAAPPLAEIEADEAKQRARVEKRLEEHRRRKQEEEELEAQNEGKGFK